MRLLLDEMFSPSIARELRRRGHDAVAVKERADLIGAADQSGYPGDGRAVRRAAG